MGIPIIDPQTLTEEQIKELYILYEDSIEDKEFDNPFFSAISAIGYGRSTILEKIFGEELFMKRE